MHHIAQNRQPECLQIVDNLPRGTDEDIVVHCGFPYPGKPALGIPAAYDPYRHEILDMQFVEILLGGEFALIGNPKHIPFGICVLTVHYCDPLSRDSAPGKGVQLRKKRSMGTSKTL